MNLKEYYNLKRGTYEFLFFTNPRKLKVNRKRTTIKGKGMIRKSFNQSMMSSWIALGVKCEFKKTIQMELTV